MKKAELRKLLEIRKELYRKPIITPYNANADIEEDMEEMKKRLEEGMKTTKKRASKKKEA